MSISLVVPYASAIMSRQRFNALFRIRCPVIAMIHVGALPGTPAYGGSMAALIDRAAAEAATYLRAGVDALAVENMHDAPYLCGTVGPEITAAMTAIGRAAKQAAPLPCGVQVLAGANREALAVAEAAGLDFVRVEGFVFAHVGDEGLHPSCAGELLRYRRQIGADRRPGLRRHQEEAQFARPHGGREPGRDRAGRGVLPGRRPGGDGDGDGTSADESDLRAAGSATDVPVLIGSGVTATTQRAMPPRPTA